MIHKDKAIAGNNEYQKWLNYLWEEIGKQRLKVSADGEFVQVQLSPYTSFWTSSSLI